MSVSNPRGLVAATLAGAVLASGAAHAQSSETIIGRGVNVLTPQGVSELRPSLTRPDTEVVFGPSRKAAEKVVESSRSVRDLFEQLGSPWATFQLGDETVYQWTGGSNRMVNGVGSIVRNELLVFTNREGAITGFTFKNRLNAENLSPFAFMGFAVA